MLCDDLNHESLSGAVLESSWIAEAPVVVEIRPHFVCNMVTTIRAIATGVGDKNVKATMISTGVMNREGRGMRSPFEDIRGRLRSDRSDHQRNVIRKRGAG